MKFIDNLVGKGLSMWVIGQLIVLNLAWMVTLAVPMATLVATLMAYGSLSSTNETTVMQSIGWSNLRLVFPSILLSGLLCWGLVEFNNRVLPEANHRTKVLMSDIQRTKPTFILEAGRFSDDLGGYHLLVKKTFPESNKIEGVFIIDNSSASYTNTLTAEHGDISFSKDYSRVILNLLDGEVHQLGKKDLNDYRVIHFDKQIVSIDAQGFGFNKSDERTFSRGDRELSADSMRGIVNKLYSDFANDKITSVDNIQKLAIEFTKLDYNEEQLKDSLKMNQLRLKVDPLMNQYRMFRTKYINSIKNEASIQKQADGYLVEIYKKFSIPFACVVFALIGAPLGMRVRKGNFGFAAGISLAFFLVYWASLIGGEKLADREMLSPFISMWLANIVMGTVGLLMIMKQTITIKPLHKYFKK